MKLNSHIIFLIVIVGIITAGVVGATLLSNGPMKQVDFDGIKVNVPSDANFVKTNDGYADSKYGIAIHPFKDNASASNYLKGVTGASVIALKNQPPQSVAFVQGDDTNVLITNGKEAVALGAKDQNLVTDMANSVVFSNHQKSVKPKPVVPGIAPPPHLEIHNDFYLILAFMKQVNNPEFNLNFVEANLTQVVNDYNSASDQGTLDQYTASEFAQNANSNTSNVQSANSNGAVANNNANTSLLDNPQVSNVVGFLSSGDSNAGSAADGDAAQSNGGSVPSVSGNDASGSSVASISGDSGSSSGGDSGQQKLSENEFKELIKPELEKQDLTIKDIDESGDYFIVKVKDSTGHIEKMKFDAFTGQFIEYIDS